MKTTFTVALTVKAPFISQSTNPGEPGYDSIIARNHDNKAIIPGTLVAGRVRQSLEELREVAENKVSWFKPDCGQWLGKPPYSKQLVFSDFLIADDNGNAPSTARNRITIDPQRGAVQKHQLLAIEQIFESGALYTFTGTVQFFCQHKDEAENIEKHLDAAVKWIPQLGAMQSIGFGQVEKAEITEIRMQPIEQLDTSTPLTADNKLPFHLIPEQAFCLPGKPLTNNLFESDTIIAGGAIKGSIANTWSHISGLHNGLIAQCSNKDFSLLKKHFSHIRISHAFPSNADSRPVVAPLSLVKTNTDMLYDVAPLNKPALVNNQLPAFALDWKDDENTLTEYPWPYLRLSTWGWPKISTDLRIRTQISRDTSRSEKSALFAYEQVLPSAEIAWKGEFDLSKVNNTDRKEVSKQLQRLLQHGIIGLGKTKTTATITLTSQPAVPSLASQLTPQEDGLWYITLQTDALLGYPDNFTYTSGHKQLYAMYKLAWQEISEEKLSLVRFFARQKMSGGAYRKTSSRPDYQPWLLTEAASIFVLRATDNAVPEDINALINQWQKHGLPLSQSCLSGYGIDQSQPLWTQTPYLPDNGYGEIATNLDYNGLVTPLSDTDNNTQTTAIDEIRFQEDMQ